MPFLVFLLSLIFGAGSAGFTTGFTSPPQNINPVTVSACYQVEEGVKITLDPSYLIQDDCKAKLGGKTYFRIRQQVKIVNAKIAEGLGTHPNNDCADSYYGSLRKVGKLPDALGGNEIFWESENYRHDDLREFLEILTKKDNKYHTFDLYINETEKEKLKSDPKYEFIRNCKETGGLVPVLEGPATPTFPPQAISLTDSAYNQEANQIFDKTGFEDNFNKYYLDVKDKYFMRIEEKAKPDVAEQVGVLRKTVQGETRFYDVFFHAGIVYLQAQTNQPDSGKSWMYNPSEEKPPLGVGWRNPSLQLTALKFITTSEWTWATPECKPAIYLYPEKPTELIVKVKPQGKITESIPEHGEDGWQVVAYPDGKIYPKNTYNIEHRTCLTMPYALCPMPYDYLYYEAELDKVKVPQEGWIVEKDNLENFFTTILPQLGLNEKEEKDFLDYWLPKLEDYLSTSESSVRAAPAEAKLFVGLIDKEELDRVEPIEFSSPATSYQLPGTSHQMPDTIIRVRFYFEKLTDRTTERYNDIKIEENIAISQYRNIEPRRGFVAVDWGGILSNGSCGIGEKSE